ncbi:MAG: membrane protein [Cyclobacteriaceae bacterium]|nr:MAG: membrane protein [Cyclobacteriaceae bacterium]
MNLVSKLVRYFSTTLMLSISTTIVCRAQQEAMFTQYMFNGLAINPAYAGSHQTLEFTALAREQWTGLEGAPSTQTFTAHSPLKNRSIGLGLSVINDKIGVTNQFGVYGSYSYRIQFQNKGVLSMGLQAGFTQYNEDLTQLQGSIRDPNDPNFSQDEVSKFMPNFGAGLYYYTKRFYTGLSSPHLVQNKLDNLEAAYQEARQRRHYFFTTGYVFDLSRSVKFKPNLLIKVVEGAPVEADINLNFLFQEILWAGVSYRSFDSFDVILQVNLTEQFSIGYAYDFATTTELKRLHSGSHELMLNYRLKPPRRRMLTPRYF